MKKFNLSDLEGKSEKRLKFLEKKYMSRISRLSRFLMDVKDFEIPISIVTENYVRDLIKLHGKEVAKISEVWNVKHNDNYRGGYSRLFKL